MKESYFTKPLTLAISLNDTLPNPGQIGVKVRSSVTNSNLEWNGVKWINVSNTQLISIDLGLIGVFEKTITLPMPGLSITDSLVITHNTISANGFAVDEMEMDMIFASAACYVADTITVCVRALPGPIYGIRNFNLKIG